MPRDGSVYVNDVTSALRLPLPLGAEGARGASAFDHRRYMQAREVDGRQRARASRRA